MLSPIQSDDGLIVTVDAKKGNEARANVEYPSAMVHYYGKDDDREQCAGSEQQSKDYTNRAAYATGRGAGTKGICIT